MLNDWWITPYSKRSEFPEVLALDHKIQIFYERVTGWQLDIADKLINGTVDGTGKVLIVGNKDAGFAVLDIILSYFEMIAKYRNGCVDDNPKESEKQFKQGVRMVFPEFGERKNQWVPKCLYKGARCGLYHGGITNRNIILEGGNRPPISPIENSKVVVNPHELVRKLEEDFESYIKQLMDDRDLRINFEMRFNKDDT